MINFSGSNTLFDRLNRPRRTELRDGQLRSGNHIHRLFYLHYTGAGRIIRSHSQVGGNAGTGTTNLRYNTADVNDYDSFDRFGRKIRDYWRSDTAGVFVDQFDYSYDLASNLTSRNNQVETSQDRTYRYDDLNQLFSSNEPGTANDRYFGRDQVGNLSEIRRGLTTSSILIDDRVHNSANELTSTSAGINPTHDAAGNTAVIPSPRNSSSSAITRFDAWNRLVLYGSIEFGSVVHRYDGLNRRISRIDSSAGVAFYYNENGQVLTETDLSGIPKAIYSYLQLLARLR